jgi:hypothetical protein
MRRLGICALVLGCALRADGVTVEPDPIDVGAFFDGGVVRVRGTTEAGNAVFVVITGDTVSEEFNRKGRLGPLWANVGHVAVAGVPRLWLAASSAPVARVLARPLIDEHRLDLAALARTAKVTAPGADVARLQREYVRLKQAERVFALHEGATRVASGTGAVAYEARIPWPDTAAAGEYRVAVLHARDGAVVRREDGRFRVRLTGLPRFIAVLAFERSALYGILSVLAALTVGFAMGLCFKRRGGAAH